MTTPPIQEYEIDEALWAAYRCYDKSAVTENLLRRYFPELTFIPSVSAARDQFANPGAESFSKTGLAYKWRMSKDEGVTRPRWESACVISNEGLPTTSRVVRRNLANVK